MLGWMTLLSYAQPPQPAAPSGPQAGAQAAPPPGNIVTPIQRADSAPQGTLEPLQRSLTRRSSRREASAYQFYACSGCHGGTGGGGMCPPLTDGVWVYGGDDDTLFRLVAWGSQTLQSKGYSRKAEENVVGAMPAMGQVVHTDDDLWRILAFVRANYHGAPECKFGCGGK